MQEKKREKTIYAKRRYDADFELEKTNLFSCAVAVILAWFVRYFYMQMKDYFASSVPLV